MTDEHLTPKVCIDGNAIRRIRERNRLTQLYIAKVVGVTTDTVSRWENNRYPSIRRDNALLLAEALEVDLAEILLDGVETAAASDAGTPSRRLMKAVFPIIVVIGLALFVYLYFMRQHPTPFEFSAERILPTYAVPDGDLPVRVRLEISGEMKGMILRERFPQGWKLLQASPPPSSLDNIEGVVRWIIKPDERPTVISYLVHVPPEVDPGKGHGFTGEVILNPRGSGVTYRVSGDREVLVGPYHWADANGDRVIDDGETLAASDSIDEMEKLHLSWETIEKIWDAGRYRWDPDRKTFVPVRNSGNQQ